jgi:hypothetical protein
MAICHCIIVESFTDDTLLLTYVDIELDGDISC